MLSALNMNFGSELLFGLDEISQGIMCMFVFYHFQFLNGTGALNCQVLLSKYQNLSLISYSSVIDETWKVGEGFDNC